MPSGIVSKRHAALAEETDNAARRSSGDGLAPSKDSGAFEASQATAEKTAAIGQDEVVDTQ